MTAEHASHLVTWYLPGQERNQPAWWRVDLGASYDVYQVIITNRDQQQGNICFQSQ